jgi:addiction module HigA family antidote
MRKRNRQPSHPGAILRNHHLAPLGLSITDAAEKLGVSRKTLSKILNGRGAITPEMALRLSRAFDTSPEMWLNLQQSHDLWLAKQKSDWLKAAPPVF